MERARPSELLNMTGHRPLPLPAGRWNFNQEWHRAIFLHYKVAPEALRKLVPKELELDLHDGHAWISVVAFTMRRVRPRWLPAWSPVSDFHEVNVRTYVRGGTGKAGVYFLSIDAAKLASVALARALSALPYRKARISRGQNGSTWFEVRKNSAVRMRIECHIGDRIQAVTGLDRWLVERYALYERYSGATWCYMVHHRPWPLSAVRIDHLHFVPGNGLPIPFPSRPDLAHWSEGVQVLSWPRKRVTGQTWGCLKRGGPFCFGGS